MSERYGHRNDETKRPSEEGVYLFVGRLVDEYGWDEKFDKPKPVKVIPDNDAVWLAGDDESPYLLGKSNGRWSGPITPPGDGE